MKHKPFLTIEEQIKHLESKGLIIDDYDLAYSALENLNYYRLSGYSIMLRKNDRFYSNIHFSDLMQVYNFDREMRSFILSLLEEVEIGLRTHIAYVLGEQDKDPEGQISYFKEDNYISREAYNIMLDSLRDVISNSENEAFVKHHNTKYGGILPVWAMVEVLTFGKLSSLYQSLNIDLKTEIANRYYGRKRYEVLENWFDGITVLRNMCAHGARLINRGIIMKPSFSSEEKNYFLSQGYENNQIGSRLFFRLIIVERLSPNLNVHSIIVSKLNELQEKYPFVDLRHYGFKYNWKEIFDYINR